METDQRSPEVLPHLGVSETGRKQVSGKNGSKRSLSRLREESIHLEALPSHVSKELGPGFVHVETAVGSLHGSLRRNSFGGAKPEQLGEGKLICELRQTRRHSSYEVQQRRCRKGAVAGGRQGLREVPPSFRKLEILQHIIRR